VDCGSVGYEGGILYYKLGRVGRRNRGYVPGELEGRIRNYICGCLGWLIDDCGRNACEVGIGDSIPERLEGESGRMSRLGGRAGLRTITRALCVVGLWNVGRSCVKEELGTISGCGWKGESENMARVGGQD
jgi:hypothetical protein